MGDTGNVMDGRLVYRYILGVHSRSILSAYGERVLAIVV